MNKEDLKDIETLNFRPFTRFCMSIGAVPSSYLAGLTIEEQMLWLCSYLENEVIGTVNNNAEALEELQNLFIVLHDYVEHYFDNLDVQEEINTKLDNMATDGTLNSLISPYIDNDIMPLINNQNASIASINAKVDALENIGPIPVTSTEDMTDTTKIYVNTTTGNWYYYDGDSWEIGGPYQSSQNIDELQGLVDAYKNNNIIGLMDFDIGTIKSADGDLTPSNNFVRTPDIQQFPEDLYIDVSSYTQTTVFVYANDNSFVRRDYNFQNDKKGLMIPANTKFRLVFDYVTIPDGGRPNISSTDPKETSLYLNTHIYKYKDYKQMQMEYLYSHGTMFDYDNQRNYINWVLGDFGASSGLVQNGTAFRRIIPTAVLKYDEDIVIKSLSTAACFIWYYDDLNGTNPVQHGWTDIYNSEVLVPKNQCFRCVISVSSTYNEPLLNVYNNDVFKNLIMKNKSDEDPNLLKNPAIKYLNSVAHQGYSTTNETNYCKIEGYQNAKDYGFSHGECDLKMTSDNVIVCSHDTTFESGGETITIATSTYNEIKDLDYYGGHIATFEEILSLCKQIGLGLYIDHLYYLNTTGWQTMFQIIKKYQMQDNVTFLAANQTQITSILSFNPKARIGVVTEASDVSSIITLINANKTNFNKFFIDAKYTSISVGSLNNICADLPIDIQIEMWTIDNIDTYKDYMPYVAGITSNAYSIMQVLNSEDE